MQSRLADVKQNLVRIGFRQELDRYLIRHASLLRVQARAFRTCVALSAMLGCRGASRSRLLAFTVTDDGRSLITCEHIEKTRGLCVGAVRTP